MDWCTVLVIFEALGETKVAKRKSKEEARQITEEWADEHLRKYPNGTYEVRYFYTVLEPLKEVSEF